MNRTVERRVLFAFCACVLRAGASFAIDPLAQALAQVELTPRDVAYDRAEVRYWGGDALVLPLFEVLYQKPLRIPTYARQALKGAEANSGSMALVIGDLTRRAGSSVRRGLVDKPLDRYRERLGTTDPFMTGLRHLLDATGETYSKDFLLQLQGKAAAVPPELAPDLGLLLYSAGEAYSYRGRALAGVAPEIRADLGSTLRLSMGDALESFDPDLRRAAAQFDYDYLYVGAQDLAAVLDEVVTKLKSAPFPDALSAVLDTPLGRIEISGKQPNKYDYPGGYLLVVDGGGNDLYVTAGIATPQTVPLSIVIDMVGDDQYSAPGPESPGPGGAMLGYAFIVDLAGNDSYRGGFLCQGAGAFGVGGLFDRAGNDTYDAVGPAQGAGLFGLGCLVDSQGDDYYHAFTMAQGFGMTRGAGCLLDVSGNDRYEAEDKDIRFPAAQSDKHNSSLSQGCGFGIRADYTDGHSMAGGVGYLVDLAGNDRYSCGVFGQGVGYWYGLGVLADAGGNDTYDGAWYVQAAAAHFAIGVLLDAAGSDRYTATMNMAQGAGHDFSTGFLIEEGGDDEYAAPNLSLGGGNANGIGIFFDRAGNDRYTVEAETTLGRSNEDSRGTLRDTIRTWGIFMDCGGEDVYSKRFAHNNNAWTQRGSNVEQPLDTEVGVGIDGEFPSIRW